MRCVFKGRLKLPDFLMTQWLQLKANRRKGIWPIPAKEDAGKRRKTSAPDTLRYRPVTPLEKELRAMVPMHPAWLFTFLPCQYSSHQERERQSEGVLKQTLGAVSLSTSGRHQGGFQSVSRCFRDVSHGPSDQITFSGPVRKHKARSGLIPTTHSRDCTAALPFLALAPSSVSGVGG